jgi:hypothetical protein
MENKLFQRRFLFNRRWFEITADGLLFRKKEIVESAEIFIRFEEVGVKSLRSTERKRKWLIATLIFLVISIGTFFYERSGGNTDKNAFVVYLILSAACAVVYLVTTKNLFYLVTSGNKNAIGFYHNNPSAAELKSFIGELKSARKQFLLHKYAELTKLISYDQQLNTLQWLENIEALSGEEYDAKVVELKILFNPDRPVIGFQQKKEF